MKPWLSLIERLVRPIMLALGLWKVKEAGRTEAKRDQAKRELDNIDEADKARDSLNDPGVRDRLHDRYNRDE